MTSDLSEQVSLTTACTSQLTVLLPGSGDTLVLSFSGEVDPHSHRLVRDALVDACRRRAAHLVVDLAGVGSCDTAGVALFAQAGPDLAAVQGTTYELRSVPDGVGFR